MKCKSLLSVFQEIISSYVLSLKFNMITYDQFLLLIISENARTIGHYRNVNPYYEYYLTLIHMKKMTYTSKDPFPSKTAR
jgi:hypothetical protein